MFDFTPRVELVGTTLMLRASGGVTARYGRRIPDRMGQRIPATGREAGTSSVWWTVFGSADGRLVGYNAFLSGTYADGGANGWRSLRQIEPRRFVNEVAVGAGFGWRLLSFTAQGVSRSLEWDPQVIPGASPKERPRHSFLSLMIGLNYGR